MAIVPTPFILLLRLSYMKKIHQDDGADHVPAYMTDLTDRARASRMARIARIASATAEQLRTAPSCFGACPDPAAVGAAVIDMFTHISVVQGDADAVEAGIDRATKYICELEGR